MSKKSLPVGDLPSILVGGSRVQLTRQMYLASGGEAAIYRRGGDALRIYHDITAVPPEARLLELAKISTPNVVKPKMVITDAKTGKAIGFSMSLIGGAEPLCRFFTPLFKKNNNIGLDVCSRLTLDIQKTVGQIIAEGFLPVDLNQMNILAKMVDFSTYFIDVASWQTPSFPATAIMASVRDPAVVNDRFTAGSTWYSFGVLATQLYLGIHPFHGMHPVYKMDWQKRMKLNASIFEPGVGLPAEVPPFSVIPRGHREWLEKLFASPSFRDPPPLPGALAPIQVTASAARAVSATGSYAVTNWLKLPEDIIDVYTNFGDTFVVTNKHVYLSTGQSHAVIFDRTNYRQTYVVQQKYGMAIIVAVVGDRVEFWLYDRGVGGTPRLLDSARLGSGLFVRNDRVYTGDGTGFIEYEFVAFGGRVLPSPTRIDNINDLVVKFFDGVAYQDLFGSAWLVIPFKAGATVSRNIPELNGKKVVDAKMVERVCVLTTQDGGDFNQTVLAFDSNFESYKIREIPGQQNINFTVTPNNICVMLVGGKLELFVDPGASKVVDKPPIDASTRLVMAPSGVHFIDGNEVQKLSVK